MSDTSSAEDDFIDDTPDEEPGGRGTDLSRRPSIRDQLLDIFHDVEQGFTDQVDRSNDQMDYWDIYNCKLGSKQFYNGNSQIFVPIVHNAINARKTRFSNQLFPQSGRNIEVVSDDGTQPSAITALLENYVSLAKLRTEVIPALIRAGDVDGQYNVYVDWVKRKKYIARRVENDAVVGDVPIPGEKVDSIEEEVIETGFPDMFVVADSDILVLPVTSDSIDEALANGGSVTVIWRWTKAKIRKMVADGLLNKEAGRSILDQMTTDLQTPNRDRKKEMAEAAGVRFEGGKHALVYETWTNLRIKKGETRLCVAWYGGGDNILGARVNPLWCDRVPVISCPVEKVAGSFKGLSKVKFCADMQYAANDAVNEGMDSAAYALMPIVLTDPDKNPRVGSMVLAMSAIWETSPQDTQFAQFPKLWQDAFQIVASAKAEISTTLSVSPAAITSQNAYAKLTQAEIANEQQVDVLTTADAVTVLEEGILTPYVQLAAELDHQYREEEITVRQYGEMGIRANMETVPPLQMNSRFTFRWLGVEAAKNAQRMQQQIAGINVLRGIPPDQYPGYRINLVPVIVQMMENLFGPRVAPLVFEDYRAQLSVDPKTENNLMLEGFDLAVHPLDDDPAHLQAHMMALQKGDPTGTIRAHMLKHKQSMEMKAQAQLIAQAQQPGGGMPGQPGAPGGAGTPRIGAQPGQVRNGQGPPGMIHPDNMSDPSRMPQ